MRPRRHNAIQAISQLLLQVIVTHVCVDAHRVCVFVLQGYAGHPVDESRSSQVDGGAESVHFTGRIQGDVGQSSGGNHKYGLTDIQDDLLNERLVWLQLFVLYTET